MIRWMKDGMKESAAEIVKLCKKFADSLIARLRMKFPDYFENRNLRSIALAYPIGIRSTCPICSTLLVRPLARMMASTVVSYLRASSQRVSPERTVYST